MQPIELDWSTSALVFIDLQQSVVALPTAPYPASQVVAACAKLAAAFRSRAAAIDYVRVDLANFRKLRADAHRFAVDTIFPRLGRVRHVEDLGMAV